MRVSKVWASVVVGLGVIGGILSTTPPASAQEAALGEAKDRVRQAPMNAEAAVAYGRALRRAGHEAEALTELRRVQSFAKGETAVAADWEIARAHIARRDFESAMRACHSVGARPGGSAAGHVCAAEAHLLWRRGTEALGELALVAKQPAKSADVEYTSKLAEGRARELEANDAAAEALYRDAIRLAPTRNDAHVLLGALLQRVGQEGIGSLRRAVELDAHDPVAQFELGRALAADATLRNGAIAAFEQAIAERPTYIEALRSLTETYLAANRSADAKRTAAAVLKIAPNDVAAHLAAGRVALAEGKTADARSEGNAAIKLMPNAAQAYLLIADAYAKESEVDLALEAYQKASGLDALDPTPLVRATYVCIAAGRFTSAKAFGKRAVADFPTASASWVAQGDALAADGNPSDARSAYESAKKARGADQALIDGKLSHLK
jgi:tetratricopeptide (TPR) repeat protein